MVRLDEFKEFHRNPQDPYQRGEGGVGFTNHGYKIVMYLPPLPKQTENGNGNGNGEENGNGNGNGHHEHDRLTLQHEQILHDQEELGNGEAGKSLDRLKQHWGSKAYLSGREEEHGPAHVHVIHILSGRESKFELVEVADGQHFMQLLKTEENGKGKYPQNGNGRKKKKKEKNGKHDHELLNENDINIITPVLNDHTEAFIQLWREAYQDKKLGDYVTRMSEVFPGYLERVRFKGRGYERKTFQLEDQETGGELKIKPEDYHALSRKHKFNRGV